MDTRRLTTPLMRDNTIVTAHTTRAWRAPRHACWHAPHASMQHMPYPCRPGQRRGGCRAQRRGEEGMRRAKRMRQHVEKREGICRTKKLVVLGRGDESATRQTLARSARGAAAEAAAVIGASESPRRRSCSNCSCDRRRPSPSGWSTHRSIAGTARRRTRPRAGRAASARRSAVPPSPPGWPRAADHRRLKQTAQRPRRDEEVSIM